MEIQSNEKLYNKLKEDFLILYKENIDLFKENIKLYYEYINIFGELYLKRYELFYSCEKLIRKFELYSKEIEPESKINFNKIDKRVIKEFKENENTISIMQNEIKQASLYKKLPPLNKDTQEEINELYLSVFKNINPYLIQVNSKIKQLWKKADKSYQNNDLNELKLVVSKLKEINFNKLEEEIIEKGYNELISVLKDEIQILTTRNMYLVNSFPYNKKELLKDKFKIEEKIKEIQNEIFLFKNRFKKLETVFKEETINQEKYIC